MLRQLVSANRRLCRAFDRRFPGFTGTEHSASELVRRIQASLEERPRRILEAGGIDRPMLGKSPDYVYVGLDIEEKPGCHDVYDEFIVQSIERPVPMGFDLVISKTLLEHVPNNRAAVRSVYEGLQPGGTTHHLIPGMGHPYALILRAVGPRLQRLLVRALRPEYEQVTGYPTYFDHCSLHRMERLFRETGFQDVRTHAGYRATEYFEFFAPLYVAVLCFEKLCERLGWTAFAAGFTISGRRPASEIDSGVEPKGPATEAPRAT